jgi:hypothetical protein
VPFLRYAHWILLPLASYGKVPAAVLAARHVWRFVGSIALHGPGLNRVGEFRHKTCRQERAIGVVSRSVSDQELYKTIPARQVR